MNVLPRGRGEGLTKGALLGGSVHELVLDVDDVGGGRHKHIAQPFLVIVTGGHELSLSNSIRYTVALRIGVEDCDLRALLPEGGNWIGRPGARAVGPIF